MIQIVVVLAKMTKKINTVAFVSKIYFFGEKREKQRLEHKFAVHNIPNRILPSHCARTGQLSETEN